MDVPANFANVPVTVQVLLGSCSITLPQLLALGVGSKLRLDQKVGEPVTILVNGVPLALGELYVIEGDEGKLGVKLSKVIPAKADALNRAPVAAG
jgi:flagellar motor switch protein FliN